MTWPLTFCTLDRSPLFGLPETLTEQAHAAGRAGFTHFTPDVFSLRAFVESRGSLHALRTSVEDAGLRVFDISGINITEDAAASIAEAHELGAMAETLGARWIQSRVTRDDDSVRATYRQAAAIIAGHGAGVALEFSPFTPINSVVVARDFVRAVRDGAPDQGVVVDTWHLARGGDGTAALDALSADELAYVQMSDALPVSDDLRADTMNRRAEPGAGELDLRGVAAALRARSYDQPIALEVLSASLRVLPLDEYARRLHAAALSVL
jgi:sugar phosphate isomerase/epimerase